MATGTLERTAAEAVAAALSEQDQATLVEYARGVMAGGSWTPQTTAADVLEHTVRCGQFSRADQYVLQAGGKVPSHGWLAYVVHAHIMLHWPLEDESVLALLRRTEELSRRREQEEYHDALMAVARALTAEEATAVCAEASRRWPRMQGAEVADVLDMTTDHDLFLGLTEPFFEAHEGQLPDFRGCTAAMHAVILLGHRLNLYRVLCLLHRAGATTEHENSLLRELFTKEVADALGRSWDLMSDGGLLMPPLTEKQAHGLAFHAIERMHAIRRRDHIDPIL